MNMAAPASICTRLSGLAAAARVADGPDEAGKLVVGENESRGDARDTGRVQFSTAGLATIIYGN